MTEADATEEKERGAAVTIPPPVIPVVMLALGVAVETFAAPLGAAPVGLARWAGGLALTAFGIVLLGAAAGLFRKTGQDPKPWEPAPELIVEGIYLYTRNPMYVAFGALQAGLGMLLGSYLPGLLVPVSWWIIYHIAIRHEEVYLLEKFGADYETYLGRVRRWL